MLSIVNSIGGLDKINAERPSTAPIGNAQIIEAVKRLSEWTSQGSNVEGRLFMGKKTTIKQKVDFALSKNDSANTITTQWEGLK